MSAYIARRLVGLVAVVGIVGVLVFFLIHLVPGDPAAAVLGPDATAEDIQRMRQQLRLDGPLPTQFIHWVWRLLHGDMGMSFYLGKPVLTAIAERREPTLTLVLLSLTISMLVGIPSGVYAAVHRGSTRDFAVMAFSLAGFSIPSFWLALNLLIVFSLNLGWFPPGRYSPLSEGLFSTLRHMALPAISLGTAQAGLLSRITRSTMLDVLSEDYVRTARAKGLAEMAVLYRHALKNAALPIITTLGTILGSALAGSIVIETVFALPGVGRLVMSAILRRDYPLVQGVVMIIALSYSLVNLLVDLMYAFFDPRVRYV